MQEQFFIPQPTPTDRTVCSAEHGHAFYLDSSGTRLAWSGTFPLPAIGDRLYILMNGIGWGIVKGYFASAGFVGLMMFAEAPPQWLVDQRKRNAGPRQPQWSTDGIGCQFGAELALDGKER